LVGVTNAAGDPAPRPACAAADEPGTPADEAAAPAAPAETPPPAAADRWATGAGAVVSGRADGVTVAAGETVASVRKGAAVDPDAASAPEEAAADTDSTASSVAAAPRDGSPTGGPSAALRCAGRIGMGADEVRLGAAAMRATTRPGGAPADRSWPSCGTIGGSGRWPGTSARNASEDATNGAGPVTRPMGGSERHAPVGRAVVSTGAEAASGAASPPGRAGEADGPAEPSADMPGEGPSEGVR
jgi:hypothetical protein